MTQESFQNLFYSEIFPQLGKIVGSISNVNLVSSENQSENSGPNNQLLQFLYNSMPFSNLESEIGLQFKDKQIFTQCFIHASLCHEVKQLNGCSNQRLEFLGDSILGSLVAEKLFKHFPLYQEGQLSQMKAMLVGQEGLFQLGHALGLGRFLLASKGAGQTFLKQIESVGYQKAIADIFEAMVGAIYLDQGMMGASHFFEHSIKAFEEQNHRSFISEDRVFDFDPKSRLQELCLDQFKLMPEYSTLTVNESVISGAVNSFACTLKIKRKGHELESSNSEPLSVMEIIETGKSKREAEQNAARIALKKLK